MTRGVLGTIHDAVRPIFFETEKPDYPYYVAGTALLVGLGPRVFALTAKHVMRHHVERLHMLLSDRTRERTLFTAAHHLESLDDDPEVIDLVAVEVSMQDVKERDQRRATIFDLNRIDGIWPDRRYTLAYHVLGYPIELQSIDYGRRIMNTQQFDLDARYTGPSALLHCHELLAKDGFDHFSGLSGGPVVGVAQPSFFGAQHEAELCGLVVCGSSVSRRIHFLDVQVVRHFLQRVNAKRDASEVPLIHTSELSTSIRLSLTR